MGLQTFFFFAAENIARGGNFFLVGQAKTWDRRSIHWLLSAYFPKRCNNKLTPTQIQIDRASSWAPREGKTRRAWIMQTHSPSDNALHPVLG